MESPNERIQAVRAFGGGGIPRGELFFQLWEVSHVGDESAFIQRGHRLRAGHFAAGRSHGCHVDAVVKSTDILDHQVPSVVDLRDNAVRFPTVVTSNCHFSPLERRPP